MSVCCNHSVFFYVNQSEFPDALHQFFAAAVQSGNPMVLIMTPEHRELFNDCVLKKYIDPRTMASVRLLTELDARETLEKFVQHGKVNARRFREVIGGALNAVQEFHTGKLTWAYGEMVDLLAKDGLRDQAITLENLWNDLATEMNFSLLCGYELDPADHTVNPEFILSACHAHTHVLSLPQESERASRIHLALQRKIGNTLGEQFWNTARSYRTDLPEAYSAALWLRRNHPNLAHSVFDHVRQEQVRA
jgi:hypothetical protein